MGITVGADGCAVGVSVGSAVVGVSVGTAVGGSDAVTNIGPHSDRRANRRTATLIKVRRNIEDFPPFPLFAIFLGGIYDELLNSLRTDTRIANMHYVA